MQKVTLTSKGRFIDTKVTIGDRRIPDGNLTKATIYYEPGTEQVGLELGFVNEEGKLERFTGANTDDVLLLDIAFHEPETGAFLKFLANTKEIDFLVNDQDVLADAMWIIEIVADGICVQTKKYFNLLK